MNTLLTSPPLTTTDFGRWPKVRVLTSHATNPNLDQKLGTLSCVLFHQEGLNIYIDGLIVPWYFRPEQVTPLLRPACALTDDEAQHIYTLAIGEAPSDPITIIPQGRDGVAIGSGYHTIIISPDDFRITSIANPTDAAYAPKRVSAARVYQFLDACGIDTMGYISKGLALNVEQTNPMGHLEIVTPIDRIAA